MRLFGLLSLTMLSLSGCQKEGTGDIKNGKGILAGAPGFSAWMIQQDNGTLWQPLNLNAFQVNLKAGQPVIFSFSIKSLATTCMEGETIELTSLQDQ